MRSVIRRALGVVTAVAAGVGGLSALAAPTAAAADDCSALGLTVYRTINPSHSAQLLTRWQSEAEGSIKNYGFTDARGVIGYGSKTQRSGYAPVTRLYNAKTVDFLWATNDAEIAKATAQGYVVQAVNFYAPTSASSCTVALHRYVKGENVRNAWTAAEHNSLVAAGWQDAGTSFYLKPGSAEAAIPTKSPSATTPTAPATTAAPTPSASTTSAAPVASPTVTTPTVTAPPTTAAPTPTTTASTTTGIAADDTFSIAIIGDTQNEIMSASDTRSTNRTSWIVANKDKQDIRYVLQTGDLSNYGWLDTGQFSRARTAMSKLDAAGLPYSIAIGNHDTAAVGWDGVAGSTKYGGSAYASNPECTAKLSAAECKSNLLVRKTDAINSFFPVSSLRNVGGAYEKGKADNIWTSFEANNTKWLVLTLELWPRKGAVAWAKDVVASHPDHNVIIQTHHYLDGGATISGSNGGYGETAPSYLYDQIVSKYSNVKLVFSGHVGTAANRQDTPNGNTVVSFLGDELSGSAPLRVVTINTRSGAVTSSVYGATMGTVVGTTSNTITIAR